MKATTLLFCLFILLAILSTADAGRASRKAQQIIKSRKAEPQKVEDTGRNLGSWRAEDYGPPPPCFAWDCLGPYTIPGLGEEQFGQCWLVRVCPY